MKKQNFFFSVLMALCAMTLTTVFTSCGSDDAPQQQPKDLPATAKLDCTLQTDDATLVNFDFFVKYYNANGEIKSEKVVWGDQLDNKGRRVTKINVATKLPATLGVYCEMKLKDNAPQQATYHVAHGFSYSYGSYTTSGGVINYDEVGNYASFEGDAEAFKADPVLKFLDVILQYDNKGGISQGKWQ